MFRAHVLIIRRSKLHYTASGIITTIVHETATYRCDDTRVCVMQFWPPDDEHMCSKYVEVWNKLIVKQNFCASSWLITEINILRCTVSKTSKKSSLSYPKGKILLQRKKRKELFIFLSVQLKCANLSPVRCKRVALPLNTYLWTICLTSFIFQTNATNCLLTYTEID